MIYHVTKKQAWESALRHGSYEAASLASEGFIHTSTHPQVAGVLQRYYKNESDLVLLHIDETRLTAPLKYELAPSVNELFPHVFGPINIDAVIKTEPVGISWADFEKIDMRVGTIIEVLPFPNAKMPSYRLKIDFGQAGIKNSSAQVTALYSREDLLGQQVIAVINFPPKQIANFFSECLVLGVYNADNDVVLLQPSIKVGNGDKVG